MEANQIICGDCLTVMQSMPMGLARMILCSPPYEDARTYGIGFKLRSQAWVDWMIPRVVEMCRVTDGIVFINMAGKVRKFRYSPVVEWLVADLTRHHGLVCGPAPYVYHRVGIPGSGSKHYHRRDWEPVYAFARPECLPVKFSDNTAMGHPPKWAPGGVMSNQTADGRRKNKHDGPKAHARRAGKNGSNQWGHPINSGATVQDAGGVVRSKGTRPSHFTADKLHTKTNPDGSKELQGYSVPVLANPGNTIQEFYSADEVAELLTIAGDVTHHKVGGGLMGSKKAHKNEAPFPETLAEFFIRSFCGEGEIVLDPFSGSGTVLAVADKFGRKWIGIDSRQSQVDLARKRLNEEGHLLFREPVESVEPDKPAPIDLASLGRIPASQLEPVVPHIEPLPGQMELF